ncbi:MAG: transglutaminase family protein [Huintestinicola sp.]
MFLLRTFIILVLGNDWGTGFQQWFLTGAEKAETQFDYLLALLISFVPFFALTVYYFSCVLYRMSFLTLVSLIPCALSVKVLTEINNVYVALIAMLNIAVLMTALRTDKNKERVTAGRTAAVFSACVFGFVLLVFSAFFPKEDEARYYDQFERLFMNSENNSPLSDYSMFSEFSGGPDLFRNFSNKYLYMLYGNDLPYFKRQTFDLYDFENLRWYSDEYYSEPYYLNDEWAEEHRRLSLQKLKEGISAAEGYSPGFVSEYGLSELSEYEGFTEELKVVNIIPENFGAVYYIAPARAVKVLPSSDSSVIYVTRGGVFRNKLLPHDPQLIYQVLYYDEFYPRYFWLELGGADFSNEKCEEMLTKLCGILSENNDPLYENAAAFLDAHSEAMTYRTPEYEENCDRIPSEIKALAEQITAGLTYDWQKAEALQSYFTDNGYVYDLNYIPPDPSVEYFLFESKRGSCTHYATAYVLMARSLGLTARYTEGYSPDITSRENVFSVKDSSSHAYPEVYIQNMGWIVFEPTVASDYNRLASDNTNAGFDLKIDYSLVFVICVISGAVLVIALIVIFTIPAVLEKRFVRKVTAMPPGECIKQVYLRISRKTAAAVIKRAEALTPFELALTLEKLTGCETNDFAYIAEKALFDGTADDTGKQKACKAYTDIREAVKNYVKEQKKLRRKKYKMKGKSQNEK